MNQTNQLAKKPNEIQTKEFDIDGYIHKRTEFIEKVNSIMKETKDYHIIQGKKSMAKGGAEKIASIFGWVASFKRDEEAMQAFQNVQGVICFVCKLEKDKTFVGEGRGAAILSKNSGDPNKTLKMAQKSAFIDAVLRASGLSDFYTQDLEDMDVREISAPSSPVKQVTQMYQNTYPITDKQKNLIKKLITEKNIPTQEVRERFGNGQNLTGGKQASEAISWLIAEPFRSALAEELPVIQQEEKMTLSDLEQYGQVYDVDPNEIPF